MTDESNDRVSVLIPARNEEANIERAVRSVATQGGIREIIAINDQSTDRTSEILEKLKGEIPQLRVISVESLPAGWTGKANALAIGVQTATGEWLLFTDADTEHRPGGLTTLLAHAEREQIDLLSLSPGQRVETWWEKAVIPLVYVELARQFRFEEISDPNSPAAAANGQYILIRRGTYLRIGGHEAVRSEILDDVALAQRAKASGARILFLPGSEWAETRMYQSFGAMWEGWTKNLYALFGATPGRVAALVLRTWGVDLLPALLLILSLAGLGADLIEGQISPLVLLVAGACFLALGAGQWRYGKAIRRLGFDAGVAKYLYLGAPLFSLLLLNSARAHQRGSIEWKGRSYSTEHAAKGD